MVMKCTKSSNINVTNAESQETHPEDSIYQARKQTRHSLHYQHHSWFIKRSFLANNHNNEGSVIRRGLPKDQDLRIEPQVSYMEEQTSTLEERVIKE